MSYLPILEQYEGIKEEIVSGSLKDQVYQKHIMHPDFVVLDNLYRMEVMVFPKSASFSMGFSTKYKKQHFYRINEIKKNGVWQFNFSQSSAIGRTSLDNGYTTEDILLVPKHDFIHIALALIEKERNLLKI